MAFAGHCGVTLNLDLVGFDPLAHDVDGNERRPELMRGATSSACLAACSPRSSARVVQVRADDRRRSCVGWLRRACTRR